MTTFAPIGAARRGLWRIRRRLLATPLRGEAARAAPAPIVVAGFFRTASGVGASARSCAAALEKHALAPVCVDISGYFGQADYEPERRLATMPNARSGTLILHANAPEIELALFRLGMLKPKRWRIVGCWAWELAQPPAAWAPVARHLSEVWALSSFVRNAVRGCVDVPVRIARPFVAPPAAVAADKARFGAGEARIVCLSMADIRSSVARKNIDAAIRIFRAAAGDRRDVALIVKTRNIAEDPRAADRLRSLADGDGRVLFIDAPLSDADRWTLQASADIFLSPHRAEGFGLPIAEAMALGKVALVTGWSGNQDFTIDGAAVAIPFRLVPARDDAGVYDAPGALWADPDETAAARLLGELFDDDERRRALGEAARRAIASILDGTDYVQALFPSRET